MPIAIIDGIATRYEVVGSGPPLLMYSPAGFDATLDKWRTQGVYAKINLLDHLPNKYTCIMFDRRECGQWGGLEKSDDISRKPPRLLQQQPKSTASDPASASFSQAGGRSSKMTSAGRLNILNW